jgi:hypothetical protein
MIAAAFLAGVAMAQPASQDAKNEIAREWLDVDKTYPEWDAKRPPTGPDTTGLEHCLAALELATRPQPDKEGALNELVSGREKGNTSYVLPPELQDNLWDWLASSTTLPPAHQETRGKALDNAAGYIRTYYANKKAELLGVYLDIQKNRDLRAIYGLLKLAAGPGHPNAAVAAAMEQLRLAYATDKQKLFNFVTEKFQ